jgi:ATP-dependent DNA helicase RecG
LLDKAEMFLRDHVQIAGRIVLGKMRREDRPAYPPRATREALANAFCHRDYTAGGGAVSVAMYDDRLEIANPGPLPFGLTPKDLAKPHRSMPWNPIIAEVLYRAGVIERWGMGTISVIDWCRENGCPDPVWDVWSDRSVVVTIRPAKAFEKRKAERHVGQLGPAGVPGRDQVGTKSALSRHQVEILQKCLEESTLLDLMAVMGRSDRTKFRNQVMNPLLKKGLVEMTVPGKPNSRLQKYRVTAKGRVLIKRDKM